MFSECNGMLHVVSGPLWDISTMFMAYSDCSGTVSSCFKILNVVLGYRRYFRALSDLCWGLGPFVVIFSDCLQSVLDCFGEPMDYRPILGYSENFHESWPLDVFLETGMSRYTLFSLFEVLSEQILFQLISGCPTNMLNYFDFVPPCSREVRLRGDHLTRLSLLFV